MSDVSELSFSEIEKTDVEISAPEDWTLAGTLHSALEPRDNAPIVLISSAAGVPHGYYNHYARYLIDQGAAAVLSYDYRGMSGSAGDRGRWKELRMFHWAQLDFPAAAQFLKDRFPGRKLVGLGHSYGGQALGLSGAASEFERYATVATMSGYWRNLDTPWSVWFQTQILGRATVKLLGYVPKGVGVGEAFPGTVFRDWANWINSPDYWFGKADVPGQDNFEKVTLPYLSIGLRDDPWGTKAAIDAFMKHYSNAQFEQAWLEPGESGKIGHLGFFRRAHRDTHWHVPKDFLLQG